METERVSLPIESVEYSFMLENTLKEENTKLKGAINEVLELLNDKNGVPNMEWIKNRLTKSIK